MLNENEKTLFLQLIKLKYKIKRILGFRMIGDFDALSIITEGIKELTFIYDDYENKVYQIKNRWKPFKISLNRQEITNLKLIGEL